MSRLAQPHNGAARCRARANGSIARQVSCPDLPAAAMEEAGLDAMLASQARRWLTNPTKGARVAVGTLVLSKIFDWYSEDFGGGVVRFVAEFSGIPQGGYDLDYFDYDWRVNT